MKAIRFYSENGEQAIEIFVNSKNKLCVEAYTDATALPDCTIILDFEDAVDLSNEVNEMVEKVKQLF